MAGLDRNAGEVVLIVDDVPDNLAVLHDALDEAGCTVLVALDGTAALQRAAQARPDIVLLDAVMPGMDGFEVARRLKADARTSAIPIVFMTGLTETEHVVAAGLAIWSGAAEERDSRFLIVRGHANLLDDVTSLGELERIRTRYKLPRNGMI